MLKNKKGFTLIELLIVIVIIGILVAVTIAVINPTKQRNRARDAGAQATMNKIALSVGGYNSAYGSYPDCLDLYDGLDGVETANPTPTGGAGDFTCTFQMEAVNGSDDPAVFIWTYNAVNTPGSEAFTITHPAYGLAGKDFVYSSANTGIIYSCDSGETDVTDSSVCTSLSVK